MQPLRVSLYPRSMVFAGQSIAINASSYVVDGHVAAHRHMFAEIAVVLGGSGLHRSEQGPAEIGSGDVIVIYPGAWHAYEQCRKCIIYNCYFGTELLDNELAWLRDDPAASQLCPHNMPSAHTPLLLLGHFSSAARAQYLRLLDQVIASGEQVRSNQRALMVGLLTTVLGMIAQGFSAPDKLPSVEAARLHPAIVAGKLMVEGQLDRRWTLAELAARLHIDRSYLVRLWKQHTGYSPMAYLAYRRAEHAAELLLTTGRSIGEIGALVGWHDLNQFNRRFKAVFGLSAGAYRKRNAEC